MAAIFPQWTRTLALAALAAVATLGGAGGAAGRSSLSELPRGGTLRVGMPTYCKVVGCLRPNVDTTLEPLAGGLPPQELFRCCLLRTLLSYNGQPTGRGGAVLRPDLAEALPKVSADGRTWTFRLRAGIRYAPPFDEREVVAQDVIRALERFVRPPPPIKDLVAGPPSLVLGPIVGLAAFQRGRAANISGLEAPDPHTLIVHLAQPAGDLGYRFAVPWTAPVPAGATDGHPGDYSRFLVASGPYMIAGSERRDVTRPPSEQVPAAGYRPGRSITLVRNPAWVRATDPLRPAYPGRIVVTMGGSVDGDAREVDRGQLDLVLETSAPRWQAAAYRAHARLRGRLHASPVDSLYFLSMNLAVPPFDDVHVRKAVNLAVDKARLVRLFGRLAAPGTHSASPRRRSAT